MTRSIWEGRWKDWSDEQLMGAIQPDDDARFEWHSKTILEHITPRVTLDIGGGAGHLGRFLPGEYIVMEHPRMAPFCDEGRFVEIGPLKDIQPKPDLVVNINSWGETTLEIVTDYIEQIAELDIPYLYTCNRRHRQVSFGQYPIWERWEPIVLREIKTAETSFIQFLGALTV